MDERKRVNAAERDTIIGLTRLMDMLETTKEQNERTIKRVKNGLRDYRLISKKIENLVRELMMTVPLEQLKQIKRQLEISYLKIQMYAAPGKHDDNLWVMSAEDIVLLISYASQGACMLCDGKDSRSCVLSRLIDELPVEVKNGLLVACKGGI